VAGLGNVREGVLLAWLQERRKFFTQTPVCTEESQAHGHGGNTQAFGNFLGGVLQNIAQKTGLAKIRRKLGDGACQKAAHFAAGIALFRIFITVGKAAAERFFWASGFLEREELAVTTAADDVDGGVGGDARDPSVEVVARIVLSAGKLVQAGDGTQKCFLACILGIRGISSEPQCGPVETCRIRDDQLREGFAVTLAGFPQ